MDDVQNDRHTDAAFLRNFEIIGVSTVAAATSIAKVVRLPLRPLQEGVCRAGFALTVSCAAGDNLPVHLALAEAEPLSFLVIDGQGFDAAYWGELVTLAALQRGVCGVVVHGAVRDVAAIRRAGMATWTTHISPVSCVKEDRGSIRQPLQLGGVTIHPGDLAIADDDGLVIVPSASIAEVLTATRARWHGEAEAIVGIANGRGTLEAIGVVR